MDERDSNPTLRTLPHSVEAERGTLGGVLIDNGVWPKVAALVAVRDFYRPRIACCST